MSKINTEIDTLDEVLDELRSKEKEYKLKEIFSDEEKSHGESMYSMGKASGLLDAILIVQYMRLSKRMDRLEGSIKGLFGDNKDDDDDDE